MKRSPSVQGIRIASCLIVAALVLAGSISAPLIASTAGAGESQSAIAPVDLNSAGIEQLSSIPGIGPALAGRILEFREKEGPFRRVEDLMKIRGIGEKSLEKLRPYVKVGRSR